MPSIPDVGKIYQGDCLEIMKTWPDEFVDLTVTSPPYDSLRDYAGFRFDAKQTLREIHRITKLGGVLVWVVGDQVLNGTESLTSFRQAITAVEVGFNLHDTMIYQKDGNPYPDPLRYRQCFEYMFIFSKGRPKTFNPILVRNLHAGKKISGRDRQSDGSLEERSHGIHLEDSPRPNVWLINSGYMKSSSDPDAFKHPAIFPERLASDHIVSWSNEGDLVFDPFSGSGTTALCAERLKRKWIGVEIAPEYIAIAEKRLSAEIAQGKLL